MNSTDALLAWARKDIETKATAMAKKKISLQSFRSTTLKVTELLERKPEAEWKSWTAPELKLVLTWKQGHAPQEPHNEHFKNLRKGALQTLFAEKYKEAPDPIHSMWTEEMEEELEALQSGDLGDVSIEPGLVRALDVDDEEIIVRLRHKGPSRRMKIVAAAFRSLTERKRQALMDELTLLLTVGEDDSVAEADSCVFSDIESDDDSVVHFRSAGSH